MFKKADWIFVALAVLVVVGVSLLPSPRDQNPPVPGTPDHRALTVEQDCLHCHLAGGVRPLPARHPKRQDCFRCHRRMGGEVSGDRNNGIMKGVAGQGMG